MTWPTSTDGDAAVLGLAARAGAAHSRTWATEPGADAELGVEHGLDRVDDHDVGLRPRRCGPSDVGQRRLGGQPQLRRAARRAARPGAAPAARTPRPTRRGTAAPRAASAASDLEQQRGLADAGLAAEQGDRAGHQATAQHPVELGDAGGGTAATRRASTSAIGHRPSTAGRSSAADDPATRRLASSSSTRVFHSSHAGQRPTHFGAAPPHSLHRKTVRCFDMPRSCVEGV